MSLGLRCWGGEGRGVGICITLYASYVVLGEG